MSYARHRLIADTEALFQFRIARSAPQVDRPRLPRLCRAGPGRSAWSGSRGEAPWPEGVWGNRRFTQGQSAEAGRARDPGCTSAANHRMNINNRRRAEAPKAANPDASRSANHAIVSCALPPLDRWSRALFQFLIARSAPPVRLRDTPSPDPRASRRSTRRMPAALTEGRSERGHGKRWGERRDARGTEHRTTTAVEGAALTSRSKTEEGAGFARPPRTWLTERRPIRDGRHHRTACAKPVPDDAYTERTARAHRHRLRAPGRVQGAAPGRGPGAKRPGGSRAKPWSGVRDSPPFDNLYFLRGGYPRGRPDGR